MKNYELITELSKYPAGHEVVIDTIVDNNNCIQIEDTGKTQVITQIACVDAEAIRIVLC